MSIPRNWPEFAELAHRWWDPDSEFSRCTTHQSAAHGLDRDRDRRRSRASARSMSGAAAASSPGDGRARRARDGHRSWREGARRGEVARARIRGRRLPAGCGRSACGRASPGAFDVVTCMEMLEHVPDPRVDRRGLCSARGAGRHGRFLHAQPQPRSPTSSPSSAPSICCNCCRGGTHDWAKFLRPAEPRVCAPESGLGPHEPDRHDLQPAAPRRIGWNLTPRSTICQLS